MTQKYRVQEQEQPINIVDQTIGDLIQKGLETAQKTGEFVIDQAPELIKEFYQWHFWMHIFWICIFTLLAIISGVYFYMQSKNSSEERTWQFFSVVFSLLWLIGTAVNIYELIYLMVAPKLYIIDYFFK
jgi:hypothetical protein